MLSFSVQRRTDLVEDVVAPLAWQLVHHSGLLQEICLDACPTDAPAVVEEDVDELAKATTVVVPQRLRIAKGLEKGICLQNLVLHACKDPSPAQLQMSASQASQPMHLGQKEHGSQASEASMRSQKLDMRRGKQTESSHI